jgi:type I restriction enzyme S subunit
MLGIEATTNQACVAILPTSEDVNSWFLYYYLTANYENLRDLSHGANQQNLNSDLVGGFKFPMPVRDEQEQIVSILRTIDRKVEIHERKRDVLQDLFKTLLHKLMTGEIRIADFEIDTSEVVIQ